MSQARSIGNAILDVENVSLSFGGVKALASVSFDVLKGEVRAIIGPNGAGKSSMLNCINGFYKPTEGTITFKGESHHQMETHQAANHGIARTFQIIALFKGMTTLDNIMTGRNLKMKKKFPLAMPLFWPRSKRGIGTPRSGRTCYRFLRNRINSKDRCRTASLRLTKTR